MVDIQHNTIIELSRLADLHDEEAQALRRWVEAVEKASRRDRDDPDPLIYA